MKRNIYEVIFYKDAINKDTISFTMNIYAIDDFEAIHTINEIAKTTKTFWGDFKWIGKEE